MKKLSKAQQNVVNYLDSSGEFLMRVDDHCAGGFYVPGLTDCLHGNIANALIKKGMVYYVRECRFKLSRKGQEHVRN